MEEFCKRGYAVIHLKREGSVAPFGRVLGAALKCGRGGPTFESWGELFDCRDGDGEEDFGLQYVMEDDDYAEDATANKGNRSVDPWMYSSDNQQQQSINPNAKPQSRSKDRRGELSLNPRIANSHNLQTTLRTYKQIKRQGLLLTVDFRTVDEYLTKLQLCCEAVHMSGALGLVYLAAAVSDFYVPEERKALHKIQSRDYGIKSQASSSVESFGEGSDDAAENAMEVQSDNTLRLTLYPVPKVIPSLRKDWCPLAFVVSFKLETDITILRQKSVMAMQRNDVHLVIGNELHTRYEKVFILSRTTDDCLDSTDEDGLPSGRDNAMDEEADLPVGYGIAEVTAAHGLAISGPSAPAGSGTVDALESATIEYVARRHFHYISKNMGSDPNVSSAAQMAAEHALRAAALHSARLDDAYRQLRRERLKAKAAELAWNLAGSAVGVALSYGIARMLQGRQHCVA